MSTCNYNLMKIGREASVVVTDFIFLGTKFFRDGDCGHKINRYLPLEKKTEDRSRQNTNVQRYIILTTKV